MDDLANTDRVVQAVADTIEQDGLGLDADLEVRVTDRPRASAEGQATVLAQVTPSNTELDPSRTTQARLRVEVAIGFQTKIQQAGEAAAQDAMRKVRAAGHKALRLLQRGPIEIQEGGQPVRLNATYLPGGRVDVLSLRDQFEQHEMAGVVVFATLSYMPEPS